ncbi:zinc ribbon domain-containing protein [Streptococcus sp. H49]|uniref:zinc ribbon domain-containing protein n=1 Tax=Streptococcus huangxiaojuni TaxID=3237239 RepID=UPI0034A0E276
MASQEKWVRLFEQVIGRQPSPEEFMKGKETGFAPIHIKEISGLQVSEKIGAPENQTNPSKQKASKAEKSADESIAAGTPNQGKTDIQQWTAAFETKVGRKPTKEEFMYGKSQKFALRSVNELANVINGTPAPQKKPMSKRKKFLVGVGFLIILSLISAYAYGLHYYSRPEVAKRYLEAVNKDFDEALPYEVWSDTEKAIKKSDLAYTDKKSVQIENDESALLNGSAMRKIGQKYLIFPNWKVVVTPITAKVTSNTKGMTLFVNNKKFATTDSSRFSKTLTRLYPGTYQFEASINLDGQEVKVSSEENLSSDKTVTLDVTYLNFTVKSNLSDGDLYIGSKKVSTLSDGKLEVSNAAVTNSSKVYVKKTFGDDSNVKSDTISVEDIYDDTITLDADGILTKTTAKSVLENAYYKLSNYASSHTAPDKLESVFKGGSKNSMYSDVVNMIETNTTNAKNRSAKSITFSDIDVTKVTQTGEKTYTVDFTVVYDFYYAYDSEHKSSGSIIQKMSWSANVEYDGSADSRSDSYFYNDYADDYVIAGKNGDSSVLSEKNTVN